jgi:deoxyribonuclease V
MIAALDVDYDEGSQSAKAAAVVFAQWQATVPISEYTVQCSDISGYVPGEFFKRELPCLKSVLETIQEPLDLIIIDGYVSLGDKPGLGMHLWEGLDGKVPVIGIAKTRFYSAEAIEIIRGTSQAPLYVTAVGIHPAEAAKNVISMAGEFRIPAMLKRVDQLARAR